MQHFFIRARGAEGFVQAETLDEAFVCFVQNTDLENLGLILLGAEEYFPPNTIPESVIGIRVTIPLVRAHIWTEKQAMDFNECICGKRFI